MQEYLRPWKLITLLIGIALLLLGADYYHAPDWDIPISFIMAILAQQRPRCFGVNARC